MSENVNRNREIMQKWIDILDTGDWEKIKPAMMELCTKDYLLHDPNFPSGVKTYAELVEDFTRDFPNKKNIKAVLEDCIGEGEKLGSRLTFEWVDVNTSEKKKFLFIVISRFEGDKIAEEWQVTAPVT